MVGILNYKTVKKNEVVDIVFRYEIAHVYGLNEIQVGKIVEFISNLKRITLNFEDERQRVK